MTRVIAALGASAIVGLFGAALPAARAQPDLCPPSCDRIPAAAWIDSAAIPLAGTYPWPSLAPLAVPTQSPRFRFEELCAVPFVLGDPREYAVAAKASVSHPPGQWQLQVQVLHWRGPSWQGGQIADAVVQSAAASLRSCQLTAPTSSPSITTEEPGRLAAVVSGDEPPARSEGNGAGPAPAVLHQYLVSHPPSSTVVELAMWAWTPAAVPWAMIADEQLFDALIAPLCVAYIASCG